MKNLLFLSSFLITSVAVAQVDPYEPMNYFTDGPFKGQLINAKERRSVKILEESPDSFKIANFNHNKRFHLATIPRNAVKDIIVQIDYFTSSIPAAHAELRLVLEKPIQLEDQITGELSSTLISDVVFSIEAVKEIGRAHV